MRREKIFLYGSVALLVMGSSYLIVKDTEGHRQEINERRELREQVSRLVRTNRDRSSLYSEFSIQVPLPDLTNDQYRQIIAERTGE